MSIGRNSGALEEPALRNPSPGYSWLATSLTGWLRSGGVAILVAMAYFGLGKLGLLLGHTGGASSWPPAGLAIAATLVFGYRIWPGILAGACIVGATATTDPAVFLATATGNTVEGLVGAWLVKRFANGREFYKRPIDLARFTILAGVLSPLISPPFGVSNVSVLHFPFWTLDASTFAVCWLGEMMSVLVIAPLVVVWAERPAIPFTSRQALEFAALLALLAVVGFAVFGDLAPVSVRSYLLPYLCLPFPIWAAFRFGPRGTTVATVVLGAIALWGTLRGYGLFARTFPQGAFMAHQGFVVFTSALSLAVASIVAERSRAQMELKEAHSELEKRVQFRTKALRSEIEERKRVAEALKESEARFRQQFLELNQIYRATPAGLFVIDRNLRYVRLNEHMAEIDGKPIEEHLDRTIDEVLPEMAGKLKGLIDQVLRTGRPVFDVEFSGPSPKHPEVTGHWLASCHPVTSSGGEVLSVMGAVVEITDRKRAEEALRISEERYRCLVELSPEAIILLRQDQVVLVNSAALDLFGASTPPELLGKSPLDLLHADHYPLVRDQFEQLQAGYPLPLTEEKIVRLDGRVVDVEIAASPFMERGKWLIQVILRDISERKAMQNALGASEARYRRLFETARTGIIIVDGATGQVSDINPFLVEMFGYAREEVIGSKPWELGPFKEHREECQSALLRLQADGQMRAEELSLTAKDGRRIEAQVVGNVYEVNGRKLIQYNIRDITLRKQAERTLQRAHDTLEQQVRLRTSELTVVISSLETENERRRQAEKALSQVLGRLVDAQEQERRRVSRELHDQTGQELTALKLGLGMVKQAVASSPAAHQRILELEDLAASVVRGVHRIAWELRPAALDDLGLDPALRRYVQDWSRHTGLAADFHSVGMEAGRMSASVETTLYRLTQEALTNVVKHAQARRVSVVLERRARDISLIIEDDGKGFDVRGILDAGAKTGRLGLLGMQERVQLAGGTVDFESSPSGGTTVFVRLPLPDETERPGLI